MILTLTPNPTIDRVIFVRSFDLGRTVRAEREVVTPSGKGVDASLVIRELGGDTVALGLNAGLNGRLHEGLLDQWGITHDFVPALGETRMAVVLVDQDACKQSTVSAPTLRATPQHLDALLALVDQYAGGAWGLICGGSLPPGLPLYSYAELLRHARRRGLVTLLDTSGEALCQGVAGLPHVLKVNGDEFVALDPDLGATDQEGQVSLTDFSRRLSPYLGKWASDGVVVTLGARGALAVTTRGSYFVASPDVPVVNTAGAGDALDGGLMLAQSRGGSWPEALALGTAAAASVLMNEGTAVLSRLQVDDWLPRVQVRRIEDM
jgi:tagatose 6-phosphate kinase